MSEEERETASVEPIGFGRPGRPFGRGPFYVGFFGGLGVLSAYYGVQALIGALNILVLIFIAIFLAIGLHPAVSRLQRWGLPRGLAVAAVALIGMLIFCGGLFALVPPLIREVSTFVAKLPDFLDALNRNEWVRDLTARYDIIERAKAVVTPENLTSAAGGLLGGVGLVFGTIFNVLTALILTVYFLGDFDRLKAGAYRLVPASRRDRVQALGDEMLTKVGGYIAGALLIAFLAGLSTFVFALIVGLAYAGALAVVVAVTDLIPQIGAMLGAVVVIVVGFATSIPIGIAAVVFFVIYQQLENWLIYPRVMSRTVRVTDLAAIVSALLGAALLGVIGALIAIPACAAVQLVIREVFVPRQESR
ncbi:MAG TPA: AI-2E family transporter [Micromonosporaceae bacterium]|jgi:predicted PurR-regulated permease PerM|nr:AI-2E family transporter [Micromonosporaceae bacterium]